LDLQEFASAKTVLSENKTSVSRQQQLPVDSSKSQRMDYASAKVGSLEMQEDFALPNLNADLMSTLIPQTDQSASVT
jgi:hypothetical protein